MHEERVDRHCRGIEDTISNMEKKFIAMKDSLNKSATENTTKIANFEIEFTRATKSLRLITLKEQLNNHLDKHMEHVKTTLRNFRAKYDETISYLRTANAKFRLNFK